MSLMVKDPGARIDYAVDWGAAYLDGQAVAASMWTVEPDEPGGIVIVAHAFDAAHASATLSGGMTGGLYRVTNRVSLTDGQIDERSIVLRVEQR